MFTVIVRLTFLSVLLFPYLNSAVSMSGHLMCAFSWKSERGSPNFEEHLKLTAYVFYDRKKLMAFYFLLLFLPSPSFPSLSPPSLFLLLLLVSLSWLSWNSLYRSGWPQTHRSTSLCLQSAGINGVCHHRLVMAFSPMLIINQFLFPSSKIYSLYSNSVESNCDSCFLLLPNPKDNFRW